MYHDYDSVNVENMLITYFSEHRKFADHIFQNVQVPLIQGDVRATSWVLSVCISTVIRAVLQKIASEHQTLPQLWFPLNVHTVRPGTTLHTTLSLQTKPRWRKEPAG